MCVPKTAWYRRLVYKHRDQMFPVVIDQVCTHCKQRICPTPPHRSSRDLSSVRAVAGEHSVLTLSPELFWKDSV